MNRSIEFRIIGETPLPKQSFQYAGKGGYIRETVKSWQDLVAVRAIEAMQGEDFLTGALAVEFWFYRDNSRKVDFDNLSKAICDAMNKIVYEDDNTILDATIHKRHGNIPGVYVYVKEIGSLEQIDLKTFSRRTK